MTSTESGLSDPVAVALESAGKAAYHKTSPAADEPAKRLITPGE